MFLIKSVNFLFQIQTNARIHHALKRQSVPTRMVPLLVLVVKDSWETDTRVKVRFISAEFKTVLMHFEKLSHLSHLNLCTLCVIFMDFVFCK